MMKIKCKATIRGKVCRKPRNKDTYWNKIPMCDRCYGRLKNSPELRAENGILKI